MFPMVTTMDEVRTAQVMLAQALAALRAEVVPVPDRIATGIMVETPAAALGIAQFVPTVDFFSIGTNDLAQYTLAAGRDHPTLAHLADAWQPAVLRLIQQVVLAAHAQGKRVTVCGELAGDLRALPLLLGLGVDALSMHPALIAEAKQAVRALDLALAATAPAALMLETPAAIRAAFANC
jgi:phosphoenolpyruvate-protein kinase (PTS system EI component)